MAVFHGNMIKKTLLIGESHNKRLKYFCKNNAITESQLFRLLIEELYHGYNIEGSTLMYNIQNNAFKVQSFLGAYDGNKPIQEGFNDDNGTSQTRYYKKATFRKYRGAMR